MAFKVIFLDVDGVLLPQGEGAIPTPRGSLFLPQSMDALNFIVATTGAVIVLSSTWRTKETTRNGILKEFTKYNNRKGGVLPSKFHDTTVMGHSVRQWEIMEWLSRHREVDHWVALDDEELLQGQNNAKLSFRFKGHVVHTIKEVGLTMDNAKQAVQLLGVSPTGASKSPTRTKASRTSVSPVPTRAGTSKSPFRTRASRGASVSPVPTRALTNKSPTQTRASRGASVSPVPTRALTNKSPTQTRASRGASVSPVPTRAGTFRTRASRGASVSPVPTRAALTQTRASRASVSPVPTRAGTSKSPFRTRASRASVSPIPTRAGTAAAQKVLRQQKERAN